VSVVERQEKRNKKGVSRRKIFKFSFHLLFLLLHLALQFPLFLDDLHRQTLATIVLSHFTMAATSEQVRKKKGDAQIPHTQRQQITETPVSAPQTCKNTRFQLHKITQRQARPQ